MSLGHSAPLLALAALAATSCGDSTAGFDEYALYRSAALANLIEVIVPEGVDESSLQTIARRAATSRDCTFLFSHSVNAPPENGALQVIVADSHTPGLTHVLESLDLNSASDGSFTFLGQHYSGADDVLVATIADPERAGVPLTVYFGVDAKHAVHFVRDLTPAWRPAFRCWRDGHIEREGHWNERGEVVLSGSAAKLEALAGAKREHVVDQGFDLVLHDAIDATQVDAMRAKLRSVRGAMIELFAGQADVEHLPRLEVHLWPDAEALALATGTWEWSTVGPAPNQINVALAPRDDGGLAAARAWGLALDRAPAEAWMLDGVALHVAHSWWGEDLERWTAYLVASGLVPDVATVIAPHTRVSPHIVMPMRAALFEWWLAKHGREALRDAWRGTSRVELPIDPEWRAWLARSNAAKPANRDALRASRAGDATRSGFVRGLQLTEPSDPDGRGFRGYGTRACGESVRNAIASGADSIALTAYAFEDGGLAAWAGDARGEPFATSTPDVALAAAVAPLGHLHVMITPQLLTTRSGSWAGWNMSESPATWIEFFAAWKACVVHYALLAELCNADTVCLGSELAGATRSRFGARESPPVPDYIRATGERWREVIAAARSAFRGALTYAAKDDGEARQLDFWDQLDLVGVDVFAPLDDPSAPAARPTDEQATARLRVALQGVADVAREHGKPALVTEIGFAPTSESWRTPQRALGDLDLAEQRRMYACLAEAVARQNATDAPLAGMFLWCWSTDPDAGHALDRSFTPQNRPAADLIARVLGRR
jgi:hypothetical protein